MQAIKNYEIAEMNKILPVECPCGFSRRSFIEESNNKVSLHVVNIKKDSKVHYHKNTTEVYYILDGNGYMELDGEKIPVNQGTAIMIKPYCRHRAVGPLMVLNVVVPAFDCNDEWFD